VLALTDWLAASKLDVTGSALGPGEVACRLLGVLAMGLNSWITIEGSPVRSST